MTFLLIAKASTKDILIMLERVFYIYYPVWFKKDWIRVFIDPSNKIIAIKLVYISKLGLKTCYTNIKA